MYTGHLGTVKTQKVTSSALLRQGFAVEKYSAHPVRCDQRCRASSLSQLIRACMRMSTARLALIGTVNNIDRLLNRRDLQRRPTVARSERTHSGTCKSQLTAATLTLRYTHMHMHMVELVIQGIELITPPHLELQIRERSVRQRRRGASCRHVQTR